MACRVHIDPPPSHKCCSHRRDPRSSFMFLLVIRNTNSNWTCRCRFTSETCDANRNRAKKNSERGNQPYSHTLLKVTKKARTLLSTADWPPSMSTPLLASHCLPLKNTEVTDVSWISLFLFYGLIDNFAEVVIEAQVVDSIMFSYFPPVSIACHKNLMTLSKFPDWVPSPFNSVPLSCA